MTQTIEIKPSTELATQIEPIVYEVSYIHKG